MSDEIRDIKLKRLHELEKQAAFHGPHTSPGVLVEIQDIYSQYPDLRQKTSFQRQMYQLDYDFLMNTVAAGLKRLTELENAFVGDQNKRKLRQLIHDAWMLVITTLIFMVLLLQLLGR